MEQESEAKNNSLRGIEAARKKRQEMKEQGIKAVHLSMMEKAKANPKSKTLAIAAACEDCVGGDKSESYKLMVKDCNMLWKCALWPHRPWQQIKGELKEVEA